jgi:hypothetical chaperone protein
MQSIGIDFGTTNTVLAAIGADGEAQVQQFHYDNRSFGDFRTTLSFQRGVPVSQPPVIEAGPWAIQTFIDAPDETRFLQSFKSFAASAAFTDTAIFSRRYGFEDLLAAFIQRVRERASLSQLPLRAVVGRPVTFAGTNPDEDLARRRYDEAFRRLGFTEIIYVLEPVAAAHFYAQRLTRDATILVGDFGGGTSDFSIVRFNAGGAAIPLGHAGVGIAGDSFDYRIIDAVVSPRLGKNATYRSWDKQLTIPVHYYANFSRWNELCLMNRPDVLREIRQFAKTSDAAEDLEAFADLISGGSTYELYQAVSRAKAGLSDHEEASFAFRSPEVTIDTRITRRDFEAWIADDLARIDAAVEVVLRKTGLKQTDIDRVFLTGGTSYVPAVRALFTRRFSADRIETGEQLLSIAKGLALISAEPDIARWAA